MTRGEMVAKKQYYERRKAFYEARLSENQGLYSDVDTSLALCNTYMTNLGVHSQDANIFSMLYESHNGMFCSSNVSSILEQISSLDSYISGEITSSQNDIDYWDGEIAEYDRREAERIAAEQAAAQAAAQQAANGTGN